MHASAAQSWRQRFLDLDWGQSYSTEIIAVGKAFAFDAQLPFAFTTETEDQT